MGKFRPYRERDMPAVHLCAVTRKDYFFAQTITGWNDEAVELSGGLMYYYHELLEKFTFLDGSPCGIEEGDGE